MDFQINLIMDSMINYFYKYLSNYRGYSEQQESQMPLAEHHEMAKAFILNALYEPNRSASAFRLGEAHESRFTLIPSLSKISSNFSVDARWYRRQTLLARWRALVFAQSRDGLAKSALCAAVLYASSSISFGEVAGHVPAMRLDLLYYYC